jgi:hypothetical protein
MKKILLAILALSFSSLAVANDVAKLTLVKKIYNEGVNHNKVTLAKKSLTDQLRKKFCVFELEDEDGEAVKTTDCKHNVDNNLFDKMYSAQDFYYPKKISVNAKGQVVVNLYDNRKAIFTFVKQGNSYKISKISNIN